MTEGNGSKPQGYVETMKYRLVFIPDKDFQFFEMCIPSEKRKAYGALMAKDVENFMLEESHLTEGTKTVYIPDRHRQFMNQKAKSGESL